MLTPPPVSQRAIALKLNISQATVSMALAGNPRVAAETRTAVLEAAKELAYRPDPFLRSLARYRKTVQAPTFHATLAWVHAWQTADAWRYSAVYNVAYDSALRRAEQLGYKLENFWFDSHKLSPARATQILVNRGIQGILLLPHALPELQVKLDWSKFSVVEFVSHMSDRPVFHQLTSDHYATHFLVMQKLRERGYQRPGLVTSHDLEERLLCSYASAFLGQHAQEADPTRDFVPILWHENLDRAAFARWLKKHRVDVLVLSYTTQYYGRIFEWLHELKLDVPGDIGVVMLCLPDASKEPPPHQPADLAGICENFPDLAERAVELLVHVKENFEQGVPEYPMRKLMVGRWHEGATLRPPPTN
jgi:LacI family transcriptional regulator